MYNTNANLLAFFILEEVFGTAPIIVWPVGASVKSEEAFSGAPIFTQSTETAVKRLIDLLRIHTSKTNSKHVSYRVIDECEVEDWVHLENDPNRDDAWLLEVDNPNPLRSPLYSLYCRNRSSLTALAVYLSKCMPSCSVKIGKAARLRFIYEAGVLVKDFYLVPYTNMSEREWV